MASARLPGRLGIEAVNHGKTVGKSFLNPFSGLNYFTWLITNVSETDTNLLCYGELPRPFDAGTAHHNRKLPGGHVESCC